SPDLYIHGVGNLMTSIAGCCQPLPGEPILGYVTSGRGVSIHREDCAKLLRLRAREPQRILQVSWGGEPKGVYPVAVTVEAYDRAGLLRDISTAIDREGINIAAINSRFRDYHGERIFVMDLDLEVTGLDPLSRLLAKLQQVPNIIEVRRVER
ncbi:ACT domain-containing protein, partial [Geoalkalibacter halelectricus]|uniref:ACT domain-containing protein n=1 Tax=Geoalkalibacter halelectricus TaxID=2847045 RepID=UPI003D24D4A9